MHYLTRLLQSLLIVTLSLLAACSPEGADTIFFGGPILTVNSQDEIAEALAVKDGRILAVGNRQQVLASKGANTQLIDLQGRTLLPGLVAAHEHPTLTALFAGAVDLSGFARHDNQAVWAALRERVAQTPPGEWIYAAGLDPILVPDLKIPLRQQLDQMVPDNPLLLVGQNLHSFWANSQAFAAAGIDRDSPNPSLASYYERDSQGELTGFIAETEAAQPFMAELKAPLKILGRYEETLDQLLANGFTSVASLGYNLPNWLARYAASQGGQPRIRQYFYMTEKELDQLPSSADNGSDYFKVLGIKLWHDGSPYTGSMYTHSPYLDTTLNHILGIQPGTHGHALITRNTLREKVQQYTREGWQVAIHTQGDASIQEVTNAIEQAGQLPGRAPTVRLEHTIQLPVTLMPGLAHRQVAVSFHINHILYYGDALENSVIGRAMAQRSLPVRSAFLTGLRPSLHADSPMFPAKPFSLMQTAMLRTTSSGLAINPTEAIDRHQALRTMTINAAYQLRQDDQIGSLEPGKWADLVLLDGNPYETPASHLEQLQVQQVYLAGRAIRGSK